MVASAERAEAGARFETLDSVRGVAAFAVVLHHIFLSLPDALRDAPALRRAMPAAIEIGRPMVILFFVLSGFLLTVALQRSRLSWGRFAVRRICRIYLPFAALVLVAAGLAAILGARTVAGFGEWAGSLWLVPVTPKMVLCHLAMVGSYYCNSLDGAVWSLVVEMRWSLLFPPLLALVVLLRPIVAVPLAMGLTIVMAQGFGIVSPYTNGRAADVVPYTLYFAAFFVLGIALALHLPLAMAGLRRCPWPLRLGLWALAVCALSYHSDLTNAVGATLLLALAMGTPEGRTILLRQPFRWLGKVSYSLYLTHMVVLAALLHGLGGMMDPLWVLAPVLPVSLLVAEVSYRTLEAPSIAVGRRLTAGGGRRGGAAAQVG